MTPGNPARLRPTSTLPRTLGLLLQPSQRVRWLVEALLQLEGPVVGQHRRARLGRQGSQRQFAGPGLQPHGAPIHNG